LKDEDVYVRRFAVKAFYWIDEPDKAAIPALIEALKDEDLNVRQDAAWALKKIAPEELKEIE